MVYIFIYKTFRRITAGEAVGKADMLGDDTKGFYEIIALHIIYNIL